MNAAKAEKGVKDMARMDRQIRAHNSGMQNIRCCSRYNLNNFLREPAGNFMITGGSKEKRCRVLLGQIEKYRSTSRSAVVIFSDDDLLREELIDGAENGELGQLYVVSCEYNNYDFFYRMPQNLISEYFGNIALLRGIRDTGKLMTFTDAFLRIMAEDGAVNMPIMRKRLENDNATIRDAASRADLADMVVGAVDGAGVLRGLMTATYDAFSPLTTHRCSSRSNLTTMIDKDCIIFIDIPKFNHGFFAEYFALVLRSLMGKSYKLILDDEIMLNNKNFFCAVELLKQRCNIDVVESYDNIVAMQPENTDILTNINRQIVFLDGNMPAVDLQTVLTRYGQFTAMESVEHRESPPVYLFTLRRGRGEAAATYQRDRVLLQGLSAEAVLSRGSSADIFAVRKLIID